MSNSKNRSSGHYDWIAPEHFPTAQSMSRKRGELVIEPNPIFAYSAKNPPSYLAGAIRRLERYGK